SILGTGRCRWRDVNGPVLNTGTVRRAHPRWQLEPSARQRLVLEPEAETTAQPARPVDAVLALTPPHYVDVTAGLVGPLDVGMPDAIAAHLAAAPAVTAGEAAALGAELERRAKVIGLTGRVPLPLPPQKTELRTCAPVPRLELLLASVRV